MFHYWLEVHVRYACIGKGVFFRGGKLDIGVWFWNCIGVISPLVLARSRAQSHLDTTFRSSSTDAGHLLYENGWVCKHHLAIWEILRTQIKPST